MKRFELTFTFLQLPVDYLMLILAGLSAYALRFHPSITAVRPILFALSWPRYTQTLFLVALGWVLLFSISGLYSTNPNRKFSREITRIITACSTGFAAITIYVFFTLQKFDSRFLVLIGWVLAMAYVIAGRLVIRGIKALLYRLGVGLRRTVIIGNQAIAESIIEALRSHTYLGYEIIGTIDHFNTSAFKGFQKQLPDEIIFTNPQKNEEEVLQAIDFANEHHIVFKYSADLFATISTNTAVSTIAGIPIIELRRTRLNGWGRIAKRLIDIIGSLLFILVFWPIYAIVSLIILVETGTPIIYKNTRVGQNGTTFSTLKFRSMYQKYCTGEQFGKEGTAALKEEKKLIKTNSIKTGPIYKIKNDPRITPFGRFIRRWSLDELPQFFNVLRGDMSLVGPRPHATIMSDRKLTTKKKSPASKNTFLGQPQLNHPAKRAREAESPIGEDPAQTSTLDILPKKAAKTQQQFSLFGLWRSASNSLKTLPLASHWAGL
jgi:lipopolysaccharide/colanic/teichoic acid biosynthesis glycosyltransferase